MPVVGFARELVLGASADLFASVLAFASARVLRAPSGLSAVVLVSSVSTFAYALDRALDSSPKDRGHTRSSSPSPCSSTTLAR